MFWVLITLLKVLKELGVTPRLGPLCCSVPAGACERPRTTMLSPEAEAHHVPRRTAYRWAAGSRDRGARGADRADRADQLSAVRETLPSGCTVVGSASHPCTYCTPARNFPRAGGGRVRPVRPVRPPLLIRCGVDDPGLPPFAPDSQLGCECSQLGCECSQLGCEHSRTTRPGVCGEEASPRRR